MLIHLFLLKKDFIKIFLNLKNIAHFLNVNSKSVKRFKTMDENKTKNYDVISVFFNED